MFVGAIIGGRAVQSKSKATVRLRYFFDSGLVLSSSVRRRNILGIFACDAARQHRGCRGLDLERKFPKHEANFSGIDILTDGSGTGGAI
jgi:hypothetical protein